MKAMNNLSTKQMGEENGHKTSIMNLAAPRSRACVHACVCVSVRVCMACDWLCSAVISFVPELCIVSMPWV